MKTLHLLSGGIDSATALWAVKNDRIAVGFDYGQPHRIELDRAAAVADLAGVPFSVVKIPTMPKVNDVVFAGRNAVLISMGAALAQRHKCGAVVIGSNQSDWMDFPDCRPEFIAHMDRAIQSAYGVGLVAPLLHMDKADVVKYARKIGVPLDLTWTCYAPRDGEPCGECYSCKGRKAAGA